MFKNRDKDRSSAPDFSDSRRHYIFEVPFDQLTDESIVCTCARITYADVKQEIEMGIANNVDELLASLEAGDTCRKCVKYLDLLMDHAREELGMA